MGATLPTKSRGRTRRAPMAEINVTPLVDVMLVLLIIFMVTAPLLVAGVPVDLPETRAAALDQQAKPVQIALDKSGGLFIDDQPVSDAALPQRLAAIAAEPAPPGDEAHRHQPSRSSSRLRVPWKPSAKRWRRASIRLMPKLMRL